MNVLWGPRKGASHMDAAAIIYRIGAQQCILLIQLAVELVVGAIQLQFHAGSRTAHHQFEFTLRQGGRRGERLSEASLSGSYQQLRWHPCCSQRPGPSTVPSGSRPLGSLEHLIFPGPAPTLWTISLELPRRRGCLPVSAGSPQAPPTSRQAPPRTPPPRPHLELCDGQATTVPLL